MKILYHQSPRNQGDNLFSVNGIGNCYFKSIKQTEPDGSSTKKRHSHTGYEFHILLDGRQSYETVDGNFSVEGGYLLAIPKGRAHRLASSDYPIVKYAVTFSLDERAEEIFDLGGFDKCVSIPISERILSNISAISDFSRENASIMAKLVENCVFETVILLLKALGVASRTAYPSAVTEKSEDGRVEMAKQFVSDNIESPIGVSEVAAYCYISEKQLTRIFYASEKLSPAAYIRRERIGHIEELIRMNELSLSEISRRMEFPNESGFSAFFKKYNGMPPGEYRKMVLGGRE